MLGKAGNTAFVLLLFVLAGCGKLSSNAPSIDVVSIDPAPVTGRGPVGSWDSSDVLNPSVVEFGGKLVDYYSGYDGTIWRTGYASSNDNGLTWSKRSKPVLDLGEWDTKYIAANGSAITVGGKVYYYFHGKSSDDHHQIGLAISSDSTTFNMLPKPVVTNGPAGAWDDLLVADPFVVQVGSQYWIYYMAASHDFKFNMGRAVSSDGLTFIKDKEPFLGSGKPGDFDEDGAGEPCVFYQAPLFYMVYMGSTKGHKHSLGWATSPDGKTWTKHGLLLPDADRPAWASEIMGDPTMLPTGRNDGTYYLWFGAGTVPNPSQKVNGQIGRMTIKVSTKR